MCIYGHGVLKVHRGIMENQVEMRMEAIIPLCIYVYIYTHISVYVNIYIYIYMRQEPLRIM